MMNWYNGWSSGPGWGGLLLMLMCMGLLVAAAIAGIALMTRSGSTRSVAESPRQVLDRRFAAGEIDADAYAAARRALEDHQPTW